MMEHYFTDTLSWQTHTIGGTGKPVYAVPVQASGRILNKIRLIRDKTGAQVVSSAEGWTRAAVQVDNKVNGRVVLAVHTLTNLDGTLDCYKFFLA